MSNTWSFFQLFRPRPISKDAARGSGWDGEKAKKNEIEAASKPTRHGVSNARRNRPAKRKPKRKKCPHCGKLKVGLDKHIAVMHPEKPSVNLSDIKLFECPYCLAENQTQIPGKNNCYMCHQTFQLGKTGQPLGFEAKCDNCDDSFYS